MQMVDIASDIIDQLHLFMINRHVLPPIKNLHFVPVVDISKKFKSQEKPCFLQKYLIKVSI